MKLTVKVWGEDQEVTVYQKSKTVWVATGEYLGEYHTTQDRSPTTAAKRWSEWAKMKGG